MRRVLYTLTFAALTAIGLLAQNQGGAFVPSADYTFSGNNTFSGTSAFTGVATLTSPVITGATLSSPTLTTPNIGVATATSVNKLTITAPATSAVLTIANGKTLTASNTLTLAGTDATTMTFPTTSATLARTDAGNTFTGVQTMTSAALTTPALTGTVTGTYTLGGTPTLASAAGVPYVGGVAAGYKLARGTITLDGSNPSTAASGLTTIISCTVDGPAAAAIPGDDPMGAVPFINSTNLDVYAWKTDGTDPTPVASTNNAAVFYWTCVGT